MRIYFFSINCQILNLLKDLVFLVINDGSYFIINIDFWLIIIIIVIFLYLYEGNFVEFIDKYYCYYYYYLFYLTYFYYYFH